VHTVTSTSFFFSTHINDVRTDKHKREMAAWVSASTLKMCYEGRVKSKRKRKNTTQQKGAHLGPSLIHCT